jgi:hypothetical protein
MMDEGRVRAQRTVTQKGPDLKSQPTRGFTGESVTKIAKKDGEQYVSTLLFPF